MFNCPVSHRWCDSFLKVVKHPISGLISGCHVCAVMKNKFTISLATAILFAAPAYGSILLTTENFAILGGTAITSTGTVGTVITNGDVGLSPGATSGITGFPPAVIVNGAIIATGEVTGQARLDLITLRAGLALMPTNINLSGNDMGGMTLNSGVYTFDVAASLNGNLVLDAQGMDNAYWVFQIGTSLTTSALSSVTVVNAGPNGGADYGIFWNAGAEIIFGANNVIEGNYISGTSITAGEASSGGARLLALAAVTLDQNEIDAYGGLNGGDWSGGLMYDDLGTIVPIPEPSSVLLSASALVFFMSRRKRACVAAQ